LAAALSEFERRKWGAGGRIFSSGGHPILYCRNALKGSDSSSHNYRISCETPGTVSIAPIFI